MVLTAFPPPPPTPEMKPIERQITEPLPPLPLPQPRQETVEQKPKVPEEPRPKKAKLEPKSAAPFFPRFPPAQTPSLPRRMRPNGTNFMWRTWKRQVPAKSRVRFVPGKDFITDRDGRLWAKQKWVVGYPELQWGDENVWYCWSRNIPDVVSLNGRSYRTEVYRLKWSKKAAVKLSQLW